MKNEIISTEVGTTFPRVSITTKSLEALTTNPTMVVPSKDQGDPNDAENLSVAALNGTEPFDVAGVEEAIESLRNQATANHKRYEQGGRKAMVSLISQAYKIWHNAKVHDHFEVLMNNVNRKLKDLGIKTRKNSPKSSQLIRYAFSGIKNFSDKQVHVYGRSLDVAFAATPRTSPEDFIQLIDNTEGGFDGLREQGSDKKKPSVGPGVHTPDVALDIAAKEVTVDTVAIDWPEEDRFRVYIAVRNADGKTADLKDALLSAKNKDALLLRFCGDRHMRLNPSKKAISAADKVALAQLCAKVANVEVEYLDLQSQLDEGKKSGNPEQCDKLRADIKSAKVQLGALKASVKAFRAKLKND